jgi:hypothetical protein
MNFSENVNRHFYVVGSMATALNGEVTANTVGAGALKQDHEGNFYFIINGADGNPRRTPAFNANQIKQVSMLYGADLAHQQKAMLVTLNSSVSSTPISGQDYLVRVVINNAFGMGTNNKYFKYGVAHATKNTSASDLYKQLAESLYINFSREYSTFVNIGLKTSSGISWLTSKTAPSVTATGLVIEEASQVKDWKRGKFQMDYVNFEVYTGNITVDGVEENWGNKEQIDSVNSISNGYDIADLEYFCMGERGDIYRGIGYPNNFDTEYLVVPSKTYNVLDIDYYQEGEGVQNLQSPSVLTIVWDASVTAVNTAMTTLANTISANSKLVTSQDPRKSAASAASTK